MNEQLELLPSKKSTEPRIRPKAAARASDPVTSFEAADRVESSGTAQRQRDAVLAAVRGYPGLSSKQLANIAGPYVADRYAFARRLPELREAGLVGHKRMDHCSSPGAVRCVSFDGDTHSRATDGAVAWWPTEMEASGK